MGANGHTVTRVSITTANKTSGQLYDSHQNTTGNLKYA